MSDTNLGSDNFHHLQMMTIYFAIINAIYKNNREFNTCYRPTRINNLLDKFITSLM